jgi:hypothetical protein
MVAPECDGTGEGNAGCAPAGRVVGGCAAASGDDAMERVCAPLAGVVRATAAALGA